MLAEISHNSREAREKMVQLMFEKYNVPGTGHGAGFPGWSCGGRRGDGAPLRFHSMLSALHAPFWQDSHLIPQAQLHSAIFWQLPPSLGT